MIEPVQSGPDLVAAIFDDAPGPGSLAVTWLGQSGFAIRSADGTLVVDPYVSEHLTIKYAGTARPHVRMTRAPLRGADLARADLVLASHKHSDHLDPGTLPDLMRGGIARLVLPGPLVDHAAAMGLDRARLIPTDAGRVVEHAGFRVRAVPSAHEAIDRDDAGRCLYLGYVIETSGFRLYHSGDSLAYEGLDRELGAEPFDVLFLPINGRDPSRGVPGNMTAAEAADLAARIRPRFVVPHHYDMFTFNTVPVESFEAEARRLPAGVQARVLRCGERWEIRP
ncbi:putative L-ascorbate-6-phosphate lactonase UlaG [Aquisphaera giovannonii]|uniref:Putative L-ascorbate-6-phosphate lactonase UlaG n=1 Tax=Aquisphaera giovannonii TaxID=406548 RepID=A0A5B9VYL5_9BACT|nr:MBL fold metallo-hydrolase [Aquisphaera giovannonii]QEH33074.1 putative L-ascorbate-6-phosphate lactonase UlaG [Aquisphaera giovannonii]